MRPESLSNLLDALYGYIVGITPIVKLQHVPTGFVHISTPPATVRPEKGLVLEVGGSDVGDQEGGQDSCNSKGDTFPVGLGHGWGNSRADCSGSN